MLAPAHLTCLGVYVTPLKDKQRIDLHMAESDHSQMASHCTTMHIPHMAEPTECFHGRWAEVSGFDGIVPDPERFKEVIMLCCAIKPLCAWNCQVSIPSALPCTSTSPASEPCVYLQLLHVRSPSLL